MNHNLTRTSMGTYQERDLHSAAFLLTSGVKLLGCEPDTSKQNTYVWTFSDEGNAASFAMIDYANGATVPAIKFVQSIQQLKRLLMAAGGAR